MQFRSNPCPSAGEQRQSDRAAQYRAVVGRGDMAESKRSGGGQLRAFLQHGIRVRGQQPNQLQAVVAAHVGTGERAFANEIRLAAGDRAVQPRSAGMTRAVGVLADDDKALFGAQDMHRLGAVAGCPGLTQQVPGGSPEVRGQVDFEAEFAAEAHAKQPCRHAGEVSLAYAHRRHRGEVDTSQERCQRRRRARALQRDHRPLFRRRGQPDAQGSKLGLPVVFHVVQHVGGTAGRGGKVKSVQRDTSNDTVVPNESHPPPVTVRICNVPVPVGRNRRGTFD